MRFLRKFKNEAGRAKGFGGCYRCGDTWDYKKPHTTPYDDTGGCFPLCESCWASLTPTERLLFYEQMWQEWIRQFGLVTDAETRLIVDREYGPDKHAAIMAAVRAGL